MSDALVLLDAGEPVAFSYEDMTRYHGGGSPGGVAHAFKVLERALPVLAGDLVPERREIEIRTAFGGPGARDGFELVTRAVTEGRYVVDAALERPGLGLARARFVFCLRCRDREATLVVREGFVSDEFVLLARAKGRDGDDERRLEVMKREMADRVMSAPAPEVYDLVGAD